jgi:hypothetical protein
MTNLTLLHSRSLANGLTVAFFDASNRYFGDYHRVCIVVESRIAIEAALFAGSSDPEGEARKARALLGEQLLVTRTLQRMGVAGAELGTVREALIDSYLHNALPYLSAPDYPARLLAKELARKTSARGPSLVPR